MPAPDEIQPGALSHDLPCPECHHDHGFLACGYPCDCEHATRPGIDI